MPNLCHVTSVTKRDQEQIAFFFSTRRYYLPFAQYQSSHTNSTTETTGSCRGETPQANNGTPNSLHWQVELRCQEMAFYTLGLKTTGLGSLSAQPHTP